MTEVRDLNRDTNREVNAGDPIAVVGVSCRLPGGIESMADLWRTLSQGRDTIREVPADRFDKNLFVSTDLPRTGKSYTAAGGFLDDIAGFDAQYFGISPKEAAHMDPQHRLLQELAAEALDDAAIAPAKLAGSDTGVYIGVSDNSYGAMQMESVRTAGPYTMSGAASSIAANRLSYAYDLHGPSMVVDTACSSSLVALDTACRSLTQGTSRTVLCGGVNLLLSPFHYVGFSQASMLSLRGRCSPFSREADGFVRAEGGGLVLLKRLSDAVADGDRVHGVILGTGTNSDGRTMGLALPSEQSQRTLLRQVYAEAGVHPDEVAYFEAHGTGTPAGDPLEAHAIGQALGVRRITGELPVGSVKSNLGHLEPASGMAGLCKALLVLRHRHVPATLHTQPPNEHIDFTGLGLQVAEQPTDLPPTGAFAVGVNSFGFGGANAHAILGTPPSDATPERTVEPEHPAEGLPLLVSARTPTALQEAAERMAHQLTATGPEDYYDVAYTSCRRRGLHPHRAVVLAHTAAEAAEQLTTLTTTGAADNGSGTDTEAGHPLPPAPSPSNTTLPGGRPTAARAEAVTHGKVAFVFTGNGSQWAGMGAGLLDSDPHFRAAVHRADGELAPLLGWSVTERLGTVTPDELAATEIAQPLLFAVQVGLLATFRAYGVQPHAVLGHSVGEVAAAHAAGALDLPQACRVIAVRSQAQAPTAGSGRMAAVGLSAEQIEPELAAYRGALELAAVNSPQDVTVAGDAEALEKFTRRLDERGVFCRDLGLDYAFHSAAMDSQHHEVHQPLSELHPAVEQVAFHSTVTGRRTPGAELDAAYWWDNVRRPVRFADAVASAAADGADIFLELGPHPVLRTYLRRVAGQQPGTTAAVLPTLRRETDCATQPATALAALLAAGVDIDWARYFPEPGRVVDLPAYPWQRDVHWNGSPASWMHTSGDGERQHPLLGERLPAPLPVWEGTLEPALTPWLTDHRVSGSVLMPATGFAEMALAAGTLALQGPVEVEHLDISNALVIPWSDASGVRLQTALSPADGNLTITSTQDGSGTPRQHATARVRALHHQPPADRTPLAPRHHHGQRIEAAAHYRSCRDAGLEYGPAFEVLTELSCGAGEVVAHYRHDTPGDPYAVHPALLDGALQAGAGLLAERMQEGHAYLPVAIDALRVWQAPTPEGLIHLRERSSAQHEVCWDIVLTDQQGRVQVELTGCRLRKVAGSRRTPITVHRTVLRAAPHPQQPAPPSPLPADSELLAGATDSIQAVRARRPDTDFADGVQHFKTFVAHLYGDTLARLLPDPTRPFRTADLAELASLPETSQLPALMGLLSPLLERHGLLKTLEDGRSQLTAVPGGTTAALEELLGSAPEAAVNAALALHQAQRIGAETDGAADSVGELAADANRTALEQYYDTDPFCRFHNQVMQSLLAELVRRWPQDRALRILEVGAGTAGSTAALLPLLPAERTRYCFTDVSAAFLAPAEARLDGYDFVEYRTLDLNTPPTEQGFAAAEFDLVIAANSLHTATDLGAALRHVATLLAPGGRLLGIEAHDAELIAPVFGTLDSFYDTTDTELRPHSLLLSRTRWPEILEDAGFHDVVQTGGAAEPLYSAGSVFLAAVPDATEEADAVAERADDAGAESVAGEATADRVAHLVLADTGEQQFAGHLAELLGAAGAFAVRTADIPQGEASTQRGEQEAEQYGVTIGQGSSGGWRSLAEEAGRTGADSVTVTLVLSDSSLDHAGAWHANSSETQVASATRYVALLRNTAAAFEQLSQQTTVRLSLVTRPNGAHPGTGDITDPVHAAPWAAARCLANELPTLGNRRICLQRTTDTEADARRLLPELLDPTDEDELVLTAQGRFVARELQHGFRERVPVGDRPFALRVRNPSLTCTLSCEEIELPQPGPGQVLLEVRAAGLNYRDVMQSAGLLPPDMVDGLPTEVGLGIECAGVVSACGPGVCELHPGDRVAGFVQPALASHVVADARALLPLPDDCTFVEAATMPTAFATVHYSLGHLARLRPGETVLVHGAAGGVGLAALQYARARGARVIATAGSALKRGLLTAAGAEHVFDSRSLEFAAQVEEATGGAGVDVVLNSLAGEAIPRSLDLLRPGGRFLELGKRDMYENTPLGMRSLGGNIAFFGVDLMKLIHQPERVAELLDEVTQLLGEGTVRPLPCTVYPAARADEAFRLLQHSRHIGKVVLSFDPQDEPPAVELLEQRVTLDPAGTYLVTGGTGGFGAATAGWLADLGARHLALVSRRGPETPEVADLIADLAARGVQATAYAADVADRDAMRGIADQLRLQQRPLRGVVHCAMQLDDAPLTELDNSRISAVLRPKVGGAAVLDELTRESGCDLFVCYSSATAAVGNFRQAGYSAGNLYLEALARQRRQSGEPAATVAWGPLGDAGVVVRNELAASLEALGTFTLTSRDAFARAEQLLGSGTEVAGVVRADWARMRDMLPLLATPRLAGLVPPRVAEDGGSREALLREVSGCSPEEALQRTIGVLTGLLANVLHQEPDRIDPYVRLDQYGMDSLMAAQVLVNIQQRYEIEIPPMELLRSDGTVADLARLALQRLGVSQQEPTAAATLPQQKSRHSVESSPTSPQQ